MSKKFFSIVVAVHQPSLGIGVSNRLPWRLKEDMAFFKEITSTAKENHQNAVIMGRKTWESIPEKFRPLPDRTNVVLSKNKDALSLPSSVLVASSLDDALSQLSAVQNLDKIFIIGGAALYQEAVKSELCKTVHLTEVYGNITEFDAFFPVLPASEFTLVNRSAKKQEGELLFRFTEYKRNADIVECPENVEEMQYLNLVKEIMETGVIRGDRTGTGTISRFGVQMRFSLRDNNFPLITTKKVFWRGVAEELLWFIKGSTNAKELQDKNIHIWDGNASRKFLDSLGLFLREEGDLGPVYGFQWRHFGAKYVDMHADYSNQGIDQLKACIEKIKTNPEDRRILMSAWNPADLHLMALPPCHMFCQFYVANGELSCQMYQRSADMGLGVPFNIASYALLTRLVAQVCGLKAGDFVHTIGDAHVYLNHIEALKVQIERTPKAFPKLYINENIKDIDSFSFSDFKIEGYNPDAAIKMDMAV